MLDLGLPGIDGFGVLERLRAAECWCPVLILSARDAEADQVEGFRLGADDYVTKPFGLLELLARVDALLRRATRPAARPADPPPTSTPRDAARGRPRAWDVRGAWRWRPAGRHPRLR